MHDEIDCVKVTILPGFFGGKKGTKWVRIEEDKRSVRFFFFYLKVVVTSFPSLSLQSRPQKPQCISLSTLYCRLDLDDWAGCCFFFQLCVICLELLSEIQHWPAGRTLPSILHQKKRKKKKQHAPFVKSRRDRLRTLASTLLPYYFHVHRDINNTNASSSSS